MSGPRPVRAPRGTELSALGWQQEAALRMLQNNLDPEVAEHPDKLDQRAEQLGQRVGFYRLGQPPPPDPCRHRHGPDLRVSTGSTSGVSMAPATGAVVGLLRSSGVGGLGPDRHLSPEIERTVDLVRTGAVVAAVEEVIGELQ